MSIAEKLVTIAENEQKVYDKGREDGIEEGIEQGKLELLTESEYMNAKVSGTAIAVNDVSPIEHSVGCTLTSDTITDFSTVEVTRYGKNLFDKDFASVKSNWRTGVGGYRYLTYFVGKGNTVTVSYLQDLPTNNTPIIPYTKVHLSLQSGATVYWMYHRTNAGLIYKSRTFTATEDYIYFQSNVVNEEDMSAFMTYIGNDLQIEIGSQTAYEPYVEPTNYQSTADGNVEGIKSISPSMTLLANNSNVVINANYLRDIDTYINNLITDVALSGGE